MPTKSKPGPGPVLAVHRWPSNGHLIDAVRRLGWMSDADEILDPTYGQGTWWKVWRPPNLHKSDLYMQTEDDVAADDFTRLPWTDGDFDVVTFDPPYKLNGTPSGDPVDLDYGVTEYAAAEARQALINDGVTECARVLTHGGRLLVKCMDQVASKHLHWQTFDTVTHAKSVGLTLVEKLDKLGGRPQPVRTRLRCEGCGKEPAAANHRHRGEDKAPKLVRVPSPQEHAYLRPSTMLVFWNGDKPPR